MVAPIPISIDGTVYGLNTPKRAKEINEKLWCYPLKVT